MQANGTTPRTKRSIRAQLMLVQMVTCTISLVIAGSVLGIISYKNNRSCAMRHLECHTELLAHKASSALKTNSPKDALKIVETLYTQKSIVSAYIYDSKGVVFASYLPNDRTHSHYVSLSKEKKHDIYNGHIHAYSPIILNGQLIGSVCVEDNLNSINSIVLQNTVTLTIVLIGTFLLAILIASRLRNTISKPIIDLTKKALRISITSDYSLRMPTSNYSEMQILSNALNEMLTVIQKNARNTIDSLSNLSKVNNEISDYKHKLESRFASSADEIRRANEDLHSEKHEHEQSERMLQQTLIKLETTNKELERFAHISAHDLQEPLRKIKSFADRIISSANNETNESTRNYTSRILQSATQMQFMINDLMAFSTVGRRKPIFRTLNLNSVIEQVLGDLHDTIEVAHAQISVENLPTIDAEKHQMQQMFRHLISNSLKFRHDDRPLKIDISAIDNHNETITISIKDNGIGFKQKYSNKIFEIFQRLHQCNTFKGTGVGLAICKRISSVHGGTIEVESTLGEGSMFLITLPVEHKYERKQ